MSGATAATGRPATGLAAKGPAWRRRRPTRRPAAAPSPAFRTLIGQGWSVKYSPRFLTRVHAHVFGPRDTRVAPRTPLYDIELDSTCCASSQPTREVAKGHRLHRQPRGTGAVRSCSRRPTPSANASAHRLGKAMARPSASSYAACRRLRRTVAGLIGAPTIYVKRRRACRRSATTLIDPAGDRDLRQPAGRRRDADRRFPPGASRALQPTTGRSGAVHGGPLGKKGVETRNGARVTFHLPDPPRPRLERQENADLLHPRRLARPRAAKCASRSTPTRSISSNCPSTRLDSTAPISVCKRNPANPDGLLDVLRRPARHLPLCRSDRRRRVRPDHRDRRRNDHNAFSLGRAIGGYYEPISTVDLHRQRHGRRRRDHRLLAHGAQHHRLHHGAGQRRDHRRQYLLRLPVPLPRRRAEFENFMSGLWKIDKPQIPPGRRWK